MAIARDKMWIFGAREHFDDIFLFDNAEKTKTLRRSRITPGEAALMLDIPNVLLVNCDGAPTPYSMDAYGYLESFCRMKKVLWSSVGSGGFRCGNEEEFICDVADRYPNIVGTYLDDLYARFLTADPENATEVCTEFLGEIRKNLDKAPRRMDIYVTWYMQHLDILNDRLLEHIDGLTLWTGTCDELHLLEERFKKVENSFPDKKKLIGIYLYDFATRKGVPADLMKHQCELSLELMKKGKVDGMIFEANTVMGVGLESELWLREWLETAKYTEIPD